MEDVIVNGDQYKLKDVVIEKLKQMNKLLQETINNENKMDYIKEFYDKLISLADDIRLILRSLKTNKRMTKFGNSISKIIKEIISNLSNIDSDHWRVKAKKEKLDNFFHNLQHIDDITDFNYTAMFNMKCVVKRKQGNVEYTDECQLREIGLQNVGATCYMNATLQILGQIQELYEFFNFDVRKEYDNRFSNMIQFWQCEYDPFFGAEVFGISDDTDITNWNSFNQSNENHVKNFFDLCIARLKNIANNAKYKNNPGNAKHKNNQGKLNKQEIKELKLILKCFADDKFYNQLTEPEVVGNLPVEAIDIGYEFFLVLKGIIEHASDTKGKDCYVPQRFKDLLSIVNPLFKGIAANDSKDLIIFLYETWHEIYNKVKDQSLAPLGGNINQAVAMNIQQQLDMIDNRLNLLDSIYAEPTLESIKNCLNNIKQYINLAGSCLKENSKKYFLDNMNNILDDISKHKKGNSNGLDNIRKKLRQFKNCVRLNVAPSLSNDELKLFFNNYFTKNRSILTDEFYFVQESKLVCQNCHFNKASYNICNILIFPLAKVYGTKLKNETQKLQDEISEALREIANTQITSLNPVVYIYNLQRSLSICQQDIVDNMGTSGVQVDLSKTNMKQIQQQLTQYYNFMSQKQKEVYGKQLRMSQILENKATVTLKECFTSYMDPDPLTGDNGIYCNNCRQMSNATTANKLYTLPKKMTIILNRGKGIEFDIDVEPEDYMDPWDILDLNNHREQCFNWIETKANLLHIGPSGMGGHFISSIKSRKDNRPRTYNDALVSSRNGVEASPNVNELGNKEMPYVLFTDTMTPHSEIDVILGKVKNGVFRDAICAKFLSLGVLDAHEKESCNQRRQQVFAYLLMYAYKKCMAYKNIVQYQNGPLNQCKSQNFDNYLSDFICVGFNMIASVDHFYFNDNRKNQTLQNIQNWRDSILSSAQNPEYNPSCYITDTKTKKLKIAEFAIYNYDNINNSNQFINNSTQNSINNQSGINNMQNIQNNSFNNASTVPALNCTLKFTFNGNTFNKTIDDVDNNPTTIKQVFDKIVTENPSAFMSYKNFKIKLDGIENIQIDQQYLSGLTMYAINNAITFNVSGEEVSQYDNNNGNIKENYYRPDVSEVQKYKPPASGISISTWLKIIFTVLAVIGGIVAAVFEIYLLAIILTAATILTWVVPKFCGPVFFNLSSSYKEEDVFYGDNTSEQQITLEKSEYDDENHII